MRVTRGLIAATLAVVFALTLGGCVPRSHKAAPPTLSPSSTPVFASDEEALAAATKAYAAYQEISDEVAHDSGVGAERLKRVTTGSALENELKVFESFRKGRLTGVGHSSFDTVSVQHYDGLTGQVEAYLCVDLTDTDVVDRNQVSTVSKDRADRFPFEVTFAPIEPGSNHLWITGSESWTGINFC